jgi:uncharacterized membrane protein
MEPKSPNHITATQYLKRSRIFAFIVLGQLLASTLFALTQQSSALGLAFLVGLTFALGSLVGSGGGVTAILLLNGVAIIFAIIYGIKSLRASKTNLDLQGKRSARIAIALASVTLAWLTIQVAMTALVVWALSSAWG